MMSGPYIQVDETPIKYLDPGNGKTGQGYFWVAHRPGEDVLFEWHTTREAKCLQKHVMRRRRSPRFFPVSPNRFASEKTDHSVTNVGSLKGQTPGENGFGFSC